MDMIFFLILFPLIVGLLLLAVKGDKLRGAIVAVSAAAIIIASVWLVVDQYGSGSTFFDFENENIANIMLILEAVMAAGLFYLGVKHKKYLASILAVIQIALIAWFELGTGHDIIVGSNLYLDGLSMIMILIIGIIGSLIIVYALGYMKDFQHHHSEEKDRRPWFFFLMFVFLSAMFGIVVSNNLMWMLFFWEITTVCSFLLIGFTRTEEAMNNSFRALILNLIGGIAFSAAIIYLGNEHGIIELSQMISLGTVGGVDMTIPTILLVLAGIIKAAQMPFHSWLLGAMVAPTPTSALLHSSTMVKAGVFLIIKLSPLLGTNAPGYMAMLIGGATFLLASMMAISQSNAKRVLAYSTIANLGLIVACAGVGTYAAVWAAIMLLIFHAVTKSLLFLSVGTAEHNIGSRDIEDMDGMFNRMPKLATLMIIGIIGMFLAPFGMLISKWAAMTAFVDSGNLALIVCIVFGSAVTAFYWIKWLGKLTAIVANEESIENNVHRTEWTVLGALGAMVVAICLLFPLISSEALVPILDAMFSATDALALSSGNMYIMTAMLVLILVLPLLLLGKTKRKIVPLYMNGVNTGTNRSFIGAMDREVNVTLRNWYLEDWFGEAKLNKLSVVLSVCIIIAAFVVTGLYAGGVI